MRNNLIIAVENAAADFMQYSPQLRNLVEIASTAREAGGGPRLHKYEERCVNKSSGKEYEMRSSPKIANHS
jgi:hypothetical protein